jgi:hypothetical protein
MQLTFEQTIMTLILSVLFAFASYVTGELAIRSVVGSYDIADGKKLYSWDFTLFLLLATLASLLCIVSINTIINVEIVQHPKIMVVDVEGVVVNEDGVIDEKQINSIKNISSIINASVYFYTENTRLYNDIRKYGIKVSGRIPIIKAPFDKVDSVLLWLDDVDPSESKKILYLSNGIFDSEPVDGIKSIIVDASIVNGGAGKESTLSKIGTILSRNRPKDLNKMKGRVWKSETKEEMNFGGRKVLSIQSHGSKRHSKDWMWSQGL